MNKAAFTFFSLFSLSFFAFSQDRVYLNEKYKETVKTAASFYRVYNKHPYVDEYFWVETYYISGKIESTATCKTKDCLTKEFHSVWYFENGNKKRECDYKKDKIDGVFTTWYENGNLKEQADYVAGIRIGKWKRWYENGNPKLEGENLADKTLPSNRKSTVISHWDIEGKQLVVNGNGPAKYYHKDLDTLVVSSEGNYKNGYKTGKWRGYSKFGKLKYEENYKGIKVKGKSWDSSGNEYSYTEVEVLPSYKKGLAKVYEQVSRSLKYPDEARKAGVQGKVFVKFFVDTTGRITDVTALNDIGYGCAKEAENTVARLPDWQPGTQRGQPKKMKMILPITFKLR